MFINLDWDKCRSLCPVAKPSPPTLPGAQLILDVPEPGSDISVDRKELRQLWEDELITYKCYNASLILDHQARRKSYIIILSRAP